MDGVRAAQQVGPDLGQPEIPDLALGDQFGHRGHGLLDLDILRRPVRVVQVDVAGAQPQQGSLAGPLDVAAGTANPSARVLHVWVNAEFRCQLNLVTSVMNGAADQNLVVPGPV
jgi:hypothetical protein